MLESNDITFAAVITITLPAEEGTTQLSLTLAPADRIETSDGTFKPLGECTLAELRQFADSMEAEAWAGHQGTTLSELVNHNQADIAFSIDDEIAGRALHEASWLESTIVLDENAVEDEMSPEVDVSSDVDPENVSQSDIPENGPEVAQESVDVAPGETTLNEAEADPASAPAEAVIEEIEAEESIEEAEPQVTVADSEPVHEDREAAPYEEESETDIAVVRPEIRILGKRRPLNHPTRAAVDILVSESAFRDAQAHALSSPDHEVAGVLVGPQPEKQPDGRYVVHISDSIIARHTRMHGASVTYTPESWRYVNDRLAELFPDGAAVIVGWYHTHPGFGIFLSGMDQFIHRNFFTQIWHVAMVLDPLAANSGFFCWSRGKDKVSAYEFPWPDWAPQSW
jgi:proteasome lid subunit RPN8/RPN11